MTQVQINETGDLYFIFKEYADDNPVTTYTLDNGGELEFINDECVSLVLPNFERQLNHGKINTVLLNDINLQDDTVFFNITVDGQDINGRINLSSLK